MQNGWEELKYVLLGVGVNKLLQTIYESRPTYLNSTLLEDWEFLKRLNQTI